MPRVKAANCFVQSQRLTGQESGYTKEGLPKRYGVFVL